MKPPQYLWLSILVLAMIGGSVAVWRILPSHLVRPSGKEEEEFDKSREAVEEAIANADRLDASWQFEDLEAHRVKIAEDKNGALVVLKAAKELPESWNDDPLTADLDHLASLDPLSQTQANTLQKTLANAVNALKESRRLDEFPAGRFEFKWSEDTFATPLDHLPWLLKVEHLLLFDVFQRTHGGDLDGALTGCRALLNSARCLGEEPTFHSQFLRAAAYPLTARAVERILAHGQPSADALRTTQNLLLDECKYPILVNAARALRANRHSLMETLENSEFDRDDWAEIRDWTGTLEEKVSAFLIDPATRFPPVIRQAHAWLLDLLTEYVEIVKLPVENRSVRWQQLQANLVAPPKLTRQRLMPPLGRVTIDIQVSQTLLRATAVALALERYRQDRGKWPDRVEVLVPEYLSALPLDPFDGKPLRYARHPEGVVVYAVGGDGQDNGGDFKNLNTYKHGTDVGIRVWNVEKRVPSSK